MMPEFSRADRVSCRSSTSGSPDPPSSLISIASQSSTTSSRKNGALEIGALTRHRAVEQSALVGEICPLLGEAIAHVGHVQIRNRGTVGGSLAHADPAAELPAVVHRTRREPPAAQCERRANPGTRRLLREQPDHGHRTGRDACRGLSFRRGLRAPPRASPSSVGGRGDFALAGAGVALAFGDGGRVERAGLALMGVGDRPFDGSAIANELLGGETPSETAVQAVAERVARRRGALVRHSCAGGLSEALGRRDDPAGAARRRATRDLRVKGGSDG